MDQHALAMALDERWRERRDGFERFARIQPGLAIEGRHLALPLDQLRQLRS
jgi:hypothetical protein